MVIAEDETTGNNLVRTNRRERNWAVEIRALFGSLVLVLENFNR